MSIDTDNQLEKRSRRHRLFDPIASSISIDKAGIEKILPHRTPMLLLDEITAIDRDAQQIEAKRTLRMGDMGFAGHFPHQAMYPGVLQIEMAGQLGLYLGMLLADEAQADIRLWKVRKAVFVTELRPGDNVEVLAEVIEDTGSTLCCAGQCLRAGSVASFCIIEAVYV